MTAVTENIQKTVDKADDMYNRIKDTAIQA